MAKKCFLSTEKNNRTKNNVFCLVFLFLFEIFLKFVICFKNSKFHCSFLTAFYPKISGNCPNWKNSFYLLSILKIQYDYWEIVLGWGFDGKRNEKPGLENECNFPIFYGSLLYYKHQYCVFFLFSSNADSNNTFSLYGMNNIFSNVLFSFGERETIFI